VRHPQKISVHFGDVEALATRRRSEQRPYEEKCGRVRHPPTKDKRSPQWGGMVRNLIIFVDVE
jgi:hypothetical protein